MKSPIKNRLLAAALVVLVGYGVSLLWRDNKKETRSSVAQGSGHPSEPAGDPQESQALAQGTSEAEADPDSIRLALGSDTPSQAVHGTVSDEEDELVDEFRLLARYRPSIKRGVEWEEHEFGPFHGGRFELPGLAPGYWRIRAQGQQHHPSKEASFKTPYRGKDLALRLEREALVAGRVLLPNQSPATDAMVYIRSAGKRLDMQTDELGHFLFQLPPGPFECLAKHETFASSPLSAGSSSLDAAQDLVLQLRDGGALEGEVLDPGGGALVDWFVTVNSMDWELDSRSAKSDIAGKFRFPHLSPGSYWVEARYDSDGESDGDPARVVFEITEANVTHVTVGGINPDSITIHGTVFLDGSPAPDFTVAAKLEGSQSFSTSHKAKTDAQGKFDYVLPDSGPAYFLVIDETGRVCPIPVNLSGDPVQDVELVFPNGSISGRVIQTLTPKRKRKLYVSCVPEGRSPLHTTFLTRSVSCDSQGEFVFNRLPEGSYRVGVSGAKQPGSLVEDIQLEADGAVLGIELRTGEPGRTNIRVVNSEGVPVADAEVFARNLSGNMFAPSSGRRTSSKGVFKFKNLGREEFRFFARKGDEASPLSAPFVGQDKAGDSVDLELRPGACGVIQVLDSGKPVPARLWLIDAEGVDFSATLQSLDLERYLREGNNSSKYDVGPLPPVVMKCAPGCSTDVRLRDRFS